MDDKRDRIPGRLFGPLQPKNLNHKMMLSQKIKRFKESERLTFGAISNDVRTFSILESGKEDSDPWKDTYLRKFVSDPNTVAPSGEQMNLMYRFLDDAGAWDQRAESRKAVCKIPDALYFSLLEFFDVADITTTNLLRRLPGIYRIYRPVLTHPDHFVVGVVRIWPDNDRGLLFYEEYNAIQRMNGREPKHVTLKGYAFKKSNFISFFASDTSQSSIHITTFTSCEVQEDRYIVFFGGFFDTLGKQMYSGKVFMERVQDICISEETFEQLKAEAQCVERSKVPPSIMAFFDRPGETNDIGLF